jgi:hypothetical protein
VLLDEQQCSGKLHNPGEPLISAAKNDPPTVIKGARPIKLLRHVSTNTLSIKNCERCHNRAGPTSPTLP